LQEIADQSPDGRVKRRAEEAIQKVQKAIGKDAGLKELRDELEQLKKDNQKLKSRLAAIEAKTSVKSTK
jgi:aminopeptidase N